MLGTARDRLVGHAGHSAAARRLRSGHGKQEQFLVVRSGPEIKGAERIAVDIAGRQLPIFLSSPNWLKTRPVPTGASRAILVCDVRHKLTEYRIVKKFWSCQRDVPMGQWAAIMPSAGDPFSLQAVFTAVSSDGR
jgi:hypothetical protein